MLSFPMGENGVYDSNHDTGAKILGDIVLSVEMAMAQVKRYGHSLEREIGYLTAHSMLHLLGYDHENGGMELSLIHIYCTPPLYSAVEREESVKEVSSYSSS